MPFELAVPARPLLAQPSATHRVLDLTRVRPHLGYRDVVPARDAVRRTARWLVDHPPERGGQEEMVLTDPFDYAAEDALIDAWHRRARAVDAAPSFATAPGYGLAYSGPGGRPRTHAEFVDMSAAPLDGVHVARPLDRAHRAVRGRAARRPGRRGGQGRAAGHRRHRAARSACGQRHELALSQCATAASARSRSTCTTPDGVDIVRRARRRRRRASCRTSGRA